MVVGPVVGKAWSNRGRIGEEEGMQGWEDGGWERWGRREGCCWDWGVMSMGMGSLCEYNTLGMAAAARHRGLLTSVLHVIR